MGRPSYLIERRLVVPGIEMAARAGAEDHQHLLRPRRHGAAAAAASGRAGSIAGRIGPRSAANKPSRAKSAASDIPPSAVEVWPRNRRRSSRRWTGSIWIWDLWELGLAAELIHVDEFRCVEKRSAERGEAMIADQFFGGGGFVGGRLAAKRDLESRGVSGIRSGALRGESRLANASACWTQNGC